MKITIKDCRRLNYCADGIKTFCKRHGVSLRDLCGEGVEEEILLNTKDDMAIKAVMGAHKWVEADQKNK